MAAITAADLIAVSTRSRTLTHLVGHSPLYPTTMIHGDATRNVRLRSGDRFLSNGRRPALIGRTFTAEEGIAATSA